ncbi:GNAT family N-acetyltransferase [Gordonia sp. CPCC 205333]|uniref:GNAT family N-acetyltransferase n=1 Tax=Gordonia sp. CPCC 205333 TaxID=3140790 RepID=UPI003AF3F938
MPELTMRPATDGDWEDILVADARAFAMTTPIDDAAREELSKLLTNDTMRVVRDGSLPGAPLVGFSTYFRMQITPPGGTPTPAAGLTWVSVAATHRRQGILRMMLTDLTKQWRTEGYPFAILTATEATIYERFGFGVAATIDHVKVPTGAGWRGEDTSRGSTFYGTTEQAAQLIPEIHRRWAAQHPGAITRVSGWWTPIFADRPAERRPDHTQMFYLMHADGYAMYRLHRGDGIPEVEVIEIVTVTDDAHTALWRVLTNLDRTSTVNVDLVTDDPLPWKLSDFRSVRTVARDDTVWVHILDVIAALSGRRYAADLSLILEVTDEFGSAGGRFAVAVDGGKATVTRSDASADVTLSLPTLGSLYFGGYRAADFARAGRIRGSIDAIRSLDAAFATERIPSTGTFF